MFDLEFKQEDIAESCIQPMWVRYAEKLIVVSQSKNPVDMITCRQCDCIIDRAGLMDDATEHFWCIECVIDKIKKGDPQRYMNLPMQYCNHWNHKSSRIVIHDPVVGGLRT